MPILADYPIIGPVPEGTVFYYSGKLLDERGFAIPSSDLTTVELTLKDVTTGDIINTRDAVDIKNDNGGIVNTDGTMSWTSLPADNPVIQTGLDDGEIELHQITLVWTWNSGTSRGKRKVWVKVEEYAQVPG